MSHTPLFKSLRRALHLARVANRRNAPPVPELVEAVRAAKWNRRQALRAMGSAAAAAGLTGAGPVLRNARAAESLEKIVIVGAGVAGLNAARTLRRKGVGAEVYEASSRIGGRMFSARNQLGPGLVTEIGGEFIDTGHEDMLGLVEEFGLELIDVFAESEAELHAEAFFFGGRHYTEAEVIEAFRPIAEKMDADLEPLPEIVDYKNAEESRALDAMSISQYLDRVGATGWFRKLMDVAFVTEYGLDAGEQSCFNLLFLISTDTEEGFAIFGDSDERYKVRGGNQLITDKLAESVKDQIRPEQALLAIRSDNKGYRLFFKAPGSSGATKEVKADAVILTLPFTLLREVEIEVELPPVKHKAIQELGYGANTKVMAGFEKRIWREQGYGGNIFSDEPFQLAWDNSRLQEGNVGGLTFYSGGKAAFEVADGKSSDQARELMKGIDKAYPGVAALYNGKSGRFVWPTYRWTQCAYSCYRPGQWTTICGAEIEPVGNLFFAGEHCSYDYQGYMNGGAETGRRAAEAILEKLGKA